MQKLIFVIFLSLILLFSCQQDQPLASLNQESPETNLSIEDIDCDDSLRVNVMTRNIYVGTDVDTGRIWGLGGATVEEAGQVAFGMGGDIPGYHAFFMGYLDKKLIVTAMINTVGDVITPSISALEYISQ